VQTFLTSGLTAAEIVAGEGQRHWPVHPDLALAKANLGLIRWARDAADVINGKALPGVAMSSLHALSGLPVAVKALKMPIQFGMQEEEGEHS
jgi:hypothetical protein